VILHDDETPTELPAATFDVADVPPNDDGEHVFFGQAGGTVAVPVLLSQPSTQTVRVDFTSTFPPFSGSVELAPGETRAAIAVTSPVFAPGQFDARGSVELTDTDGATLGDPAAVQVLFGDVAASQDLLGCIYCFFVLDLLHRGGVLPCPESCPNADVLCLDDEEPVSKRGPAPRDGTPLLQRLRHDLMETTPAGRYYAALYDHLSPALAVALLGEPTFAYRILDAQGPWLDGLQALVDGNGNEYVITQAMEDSLLQILHTFRVGGNPELAKALAAEEERLDLDSLAGLTMLQFWERVNAVDLPEGLAEVPAVSSLGLLALAVLLAAAGFLALRRRPRGRLLLGLPIAFLAATTSIGCVDQRALEINGRISVNRRLMANLAPPGTLQPGPFISDGGERHDALLDPLYPAEIAPADLRQLRASDCFWIESGAPLTLNYELVFSDYQGDHTLSLDRVGSCTLSHPETRKALKIDGKWPAVTFALETPGFIEWTGAPLADPYNRCVAFDPAADIWMNPAQRDAIDPGKVDCNDPQRRSSHYCTGRRPRDTRTLACPLHYPHAEGVFDGMINTLHLYVSDGICGLGCALPGPIEDTVYALEWLEPAKLLNGAAVGAVLVSAPERLEPQIKTVAVSRRLARPLTFFKEVPGLPPGQRGEIWRWSVPDTARGWQENFSPQLRVARVRFFVQTGVDDAGQPIRRYLSGAQFPAKLVLENGSSASLRTCTAPSNEARSDYDVEGCVDLFATPTYLSSDLKAKLEWNVYWQGPASTSLPVKPGDPVFIEFDVRDWGLERNHTLVRIEGGGDRGSVQTGAPQRLSDVFEVLNDGVGGITIENLWFESANGTRDTSGELTVAALHPAATPPFRLPGLSAFTVDVDVLLQQEGTRERFLVIEASQGGMPPRQVRRPLRVTSQDASWYATPAGGLYRRRPGPGQNPIDYERWGVVVMNTGYLDFDRVAASVTGTDANAFTVTASDCAAAGATPAQPLKPPPATCSLPSGASEALRIHFHPTHVGPSQAELVLTADNPRLREWRIPLAGYCSEEWQDAQGGVHTARCNYPRP
jgi:hypothetical protein